MLPEQTMDEDVAAANLAQKDTLGAAVEEGDELQRQRAAAPEDAAVNHRPHVGVPAAMEQKLALVYWTHPHTW
jgi:hypothetical protein